MSKTGKCGHCGFEPVAVRAKTCPKCNGEDPVLAGATLGDWGKGLGFAALALAAMVGLLVIFGFPN
ncbi:MAG: hypothetical protein ACRBBO_12815 [Cognatishimia sp.]